MTSTSQTIHRFWTFRNPVKEQAQVKCGSKREALHEFKEAQSARSGLSFP